MIDWSLVGFALVGGWVVSVIEGMPHRHRVLFSIGTGLMTALVSLLVHR